MGVAVLRKQGLWQPVDPLRLAANIDAVLFDLDGTLLNSDDVAVELLAARLRPLLRQRSLLAARRLLMFAESPGNSLITLLDRFGLDRPVMSLNHRIKHQGASRTVRHYRTVKGIGDMLLQVAAKYKLGIVTTRTRFHIDAFLTQQAALKPLFAVCCGLEDTARLKPHPEPVELAASKLGLPANRCLMVGDTTVDIHAARRAGAWACGVLCGFGERRELERAGAHLILDSTADLKDILFST
jgi:phosphoglycolate phosphatase